MKRSILLFNIFLCVSIVTNASGSTRVADVEKKFQESFPLQQDDEIFISNQFGDVNVRLWDKAEIEVHVSMSASAKNTERAQAILDQIEIEAEKVGRKVSFQTNISKRKKNIKSKGSHGFSIDYEVRMPNNYNLEIKNQFGKILIPDYDGEIKLVSQFGGIDGGRLTHPDDISVEFGSIDLDLLSGGNSSIKFSKADIREISGALDLRLEFCNDVELEAGDNIESLTIKASNSNLELMVPSNLPGDFDIRTSFGSFNNKTDFSIPDEEEKGDFDMNFDGHYRGSSGSGNVPIRIRSSFSKIKLMN